MQYIHIKRYVDKVAVVETKMSKDVVLPIADARGLRDEISKLLADLYELRSSQSVAKQDEVIQIEIKGGTFK